MLIRFKQSFNIALKFLFNQQYTLRNVVNCRESRKYAQKNFLLIMNANLNNVKNQLNTIYNNINSSLRKKNIKYSKKNITINKFLKNLNNCKHN